MIGHREILIEGRQRSGRTYFQFSEIAEIFNLELQEERGELLVRGARGEIRLTDGRPLVRSGDEYILLSENVWKLSEQEWYVPADFVRKALPGIAAYRISTVSPGRYRIQGLGENRVRVDTQVHRDRVTLVFTASEPVAGRVREVGRYIEVAFAEKLVVPLVERKPAEPRLIASLSFDDQSGLGVFRIEKGDRFSHFKQRTSASGRLILDIFPRPGYRIASSGPRPARNPVPPSGLPPDRESGGVTAGLPVDADTPAGIAVIDPGHGGQDRGVDIQLAEAPEKNLVLQISDTLEMELGRLGIPARLTRYRDVNLGIEQRSAVANYYRAGVYIGFHVGAAPSPETRGPVVYVYAPVPPEETGVRDGEEMPDPSRLESSRMEQSEKSESPLVAWDEGQLEFLRESRRLGNRIQSALNRLFQTDNPLASAPLGVLAPIRAPAIVVEVGQLSNPEDRELLAQPEFISAVARMLAAEIESFRSPSGNWRIRP